MDTGLLVGISGLRISVQCVPEGDLDIPRDSLQGMTELLIVAFSTKSLTRVKTMVFVGASYKHGRVQ